MPLVVAGALVVAAPAAAAPAAVDGGSLSWTQVNNYDVTAPAGTDRTWLGYVTRPGPAGPDGTATPVAPLTAPTVDPSSPRGADKLYTWAFPATGGSYEAATGAGTVTFTGGVTFTSVPHGFSIKIAEPQLTLNGLSGVMRASGEYTDGGQIPYSDQPIFNLDLSGSTVVLRPDGSREIAGIVPTLAVTGLPFPANYTGGVSGPDRTPNTFGSFTLKLHTAAAAIAEGPRGPQGEQGVQGVPGVQGIQGVPGKQVTVRRYVVHLAKAPFSGRGTNPVTLRRSGRVVATGTIRRRVLRVTLRPATLSLAGRYSIRVWSARARARTIVVG